LLKSVLRPNNCVPLNRIIVATKPAIFHPFFILFIKNTVVRLSYIYLRNCDAAATVNLRIYYFPSSTKFLFLIASALFILLLLFFFVLTCFSIWDYPLLCRRVWICVCQQFAYCLCFCYKYLFTLYKRRNNTEKKINK